VEAFTITAIHLQQTLYSVPKTGHILFSSDDDKEKQQQR